MKLFAAPQTKTLKDGSIRIDIQTITPEYIDNQIKCIKSVCNLDLNEVISVIRKSENSCVAKKNLISIFNIASDIADFVLDIDLRQTNNYLNNVEFCNVEIARWTALKAIVKYQPNLIAIQ